MARHVRQAAHRLLLISLLLVATPSHALSQWQDDQGRPWQLTEKLPTRWIVLGPHLVDMLAALGASARIVGVQDDYAIPGRHVVSMSGHPIVGQSGNISEERVRALRPDVIVFWPTGLSPVQQRRLSRLGLPLLAIAPKTLDDIPTRIEWLGALAGLRTHARTLATNERAALQKTRLRYATAGKRLTGFYQVWQQPLYSLSQHHLVSQAMRLCGVDSIVPAGTIEAPVLNAEAVLAAQTEIILVGSERLASAQNFWRRFSTLPAVRHHAIVGIDDYALTRPGLSLLRGIPRLCQAVSPWRMASGVPK